MQLATSRILGVQGTGNGDRRRRSDHWAGGPERSLFGQLKAIHLTQEVQPIILKPDQAFNNLQPPIFRLQVAIWVSQVRMRAAPVPPLPGQHRPELAASDRGRPPTQCPTSSEGGVAVDALQAILGEVLLVLAGLAVVLLAVILVLAEAHLILRLGRKLTRNVSEERGGR